MKAARCRGINSLRSLEHVPLKFDHAAMVQHAHLSHPNSGLPEFGI
jgi:hypothetical protein